MRSTNCKYLRYNENVNDVMYAKGVTNTVRNISFTMYDALISYLNNIFDNQRVFICI